MDCSTIQKKVFQYANNKLDEKQVEKMDLHIKGCLECLTYFYHFEKTNRALENLKLA